MTAAQSLGGKSVSKKKKERVNVCQDIKWKQGINSQTIATTHQVTSMSLFIEAFKEAGNYRDDSEPIVLSDSSSSDDEAEQYKDHSDYKKVKLDNTNNGYNENKVKMEKMDQIVDSNFEKDIFDEIMNLQSTSSRSDVPSQKHVLSLEEERYKTKKEDYYLNAIPVKELSGEQSNVYDLVVNKGRSVFFTGPAGSGKTTLLKTIINGLRKKHNAYNHPYDLRVAVTASTGLAAMNLKGQTFHSHLRIGLGNDSAKALAKRSESKMGIHDNWYHLRVLIIDECSLINQKLFDKLNELAKILKKKRAPFGGVQLVLVGDFYQLPPIIESFPVLRNIGIVENEEEYTNYKINRFCFCSNAWKECIKYQVELTEVHRQKTDAVFIDYLNEIRKGNITDEIDSEMQKLSRELKPIKGVVPTQLFPTKFKVSTYNSEQMEKLKSKSYKYKAVTGGKLKGTRGFDKMVDACILPLHLELKVGAQVMLVKNNQALDLVNGTKGIVVDFVEFPKHFFDTMDPNKPVHFDPCSVDGLLGNVTGIDLSSPRNCTADLAEALDANENTLDPQNPARIFPVVKFLRDPKSSTLSEPIVVVPECYEIENIRDKGVLFSMTQVPLILAWAISIHKSQGQTYNFMKVDLSETFEDGQSYVAISRATSRNGLQLTGWNRSKVMVNELVKQFYLGLRTYKGWESDDDYS